MILFDAAKQGLDVIRGMLIVGGIFLATIVIGELVHWAGHRRALRRRARRSAY